MTSVAVDDLARAVYEVQPQSYFLVPWDVLSEPAKSIWRQIASGVTERIDGREWFRVQDRLPSCNLRPGSFGVPVFVNALAPDQNVRPAFYGCRLTNRPTFYYSGAILEDVRTWQPAGNRR